MKVMFARGARGGASVGASLPPCCPLEPPQVPLRNFGIVKRRKEKRGRREREKREGRRNWALLGPNSGSAPAWSSQVAVAIIVYHWNKQKVYFVQLSQKSNFYPPTIKPDIWPPPTHRNRATFLHKWFDAKVANNFEFFRIFHMCNFRNKEVSPREL